MLYQIIAQSPPPQQPVKITRIDCLQAAPWSCRPLPPHSPIWLSHRGQHNVPARAHCAEAVRCHRNRSVCIQLLLRPEQSIWLRVACRTSLQAGASGSARQSPRLAKRLSYNAWAASPCQWHTLVSSENSCRSPPRLSPWPTPLLDIHQWSTGGRRWCSGFFMRAVRGRYKSHLDQLKSRSNRRQSSSSHQPDSAVASRVASLC